MYHEKRLRIDGDVKSGLRFITANGWVIGEATKESAETYQRWEEQLAMCAVDAEWEAMRAAVATEDDAPHWDPEERAFGASFSGEDSKRFRGIVVGANFVSSSSDSAESSLEAIGPYHSEGSILAMKGSARDGGRYRESPSHNLPRSG
jgi:hypothetical protein